MSLVKGKMIRQEAIDLAKGNSETGMKAVALAIVYLADVIKEGK